MIRAASLDDAARLSEIYAYYVRETAVTFEYTAPTEEEFRERVRNTMKRYPYLVAEADGKIEGYTCAGPFYGRAAYDWSCETTVYLDPGARKRGIGRMLYEALEQKLRDMGIRNEYACIALPIGDDPYVTKNSADFHTHMGFHTAGIFRSCGYKFGRWYDMVWMEKMIGPHDAEPAPVFKDQA